MSGLSARRILVRQNRRSRAIRFSATASFFAGAVLVPLGGIALARAWKADRRYLVLAAFAVLFGVQQIVEGVLWLGLDDPQGVAPRGAAIVFLLFAYLVWLVLTPLAAALVEERRWLRRIFLGMTVFGGLYGLSLFTGFRSSCRF